MSSHYKIVQAEKIQGMSSWQGHGTWEYHGGKYGPNRRDMHNSRGKKKGLRRARRRVGKHLTQEQE